MTTGRIAAFRAPCGVKPSCLRVKMSCFSSHINGEDLYDLGSRLDGHDPCGCGIKVATQERALDGHDPCGYFIPLAHLISASFTEKSKALAAILAHGFIGLFEKFTQ